MKQKILYILLAGILLLTACGNSDADATPTSELEAIQAQAFETISAAMTQTALAAPKTPTSAPTMLPTLAPATIISTTITPPVATQPVVTSPTASCYQLRFVSDVTIPDNTQMTPRQTFTKTWKVKNTGSCAWDKGFVFAFVGGEQMSGANYTLPSAVAANGELNISIPMVAPTKSGSLRGNWRMQTAGGTYFGDEVYVLIVVGGATATKTSIPPTATTQPSYP